MEPNFKMVLDEMKAMKSSFEGRIAVVNSSLGKHIGAVERTISDHFSRLEDVVQVFDEWKSVVNTSVKELRAEIDAIRKSEEVRGEDARGDDGSPQDGEPCSTGFDSSGCNRRPAAARGDCGRGVDRRSSTHHDHDRGVMLHQASSRGDRSRSVVLRRSQGQ
jgi:hypothetical protein